MLIEQMNAFCMKKNLWQFEGHRILLLQDVSVDTAQKWWEFLDSKCIPLTLIIEINFISGSAF